jgi:hypothetical protein
MTKSENWRTLNDGERDKMMSDMKVAVQQQDAKGRKKYGYVFQGDPFEHLGQEITDAAVYWQREKIKRAEESANLESLVKTARIMVALAQGDKPMAKTMDEGQVQEVIDFVVELGRGLALNNIQIGRLVKAARSVLGAGLHRGSSYSGESFKECADDLAEALLAFSEEFND